MLVLIYLLGDLINYLKDGKCDCEVCSPKIVITVTDTSDVEQKQKQEPKTVGKLKGSFVILLLKCRTIHL